MPATTQQSEAIAHAFVQQVFTADRQVAKVDVVELADAAEAAYNWAETNQAAYNTALTTPFKTVATLKQKAWLLAFAIRELVKVS